ncbi:MAG: YqaA family protein [Candidatus Paceibacterota bacterium]
METSQKLSRRERVAKWAHENAESKRAQFWLGIWSFAEASIFPIPADVMLIGMLMAGAKRWRYLIALTTATSVAGALFGYLIGFGFFDVFGDAIISFYALEQEFLSVQGYFQASAFWAILVSAFTPIPFKIFTISAGLFHVHLIPFILGSIIGRSLRYILVGWAAHTFGERIFKLIMRYFNTASIILIVLIVLYIILF